MGYNEIVSFYSTPENPQTDLCGLIGYLQRAGPSANINEIVTFPFGNGVQQETALSSILADNPEPGVVFVLLRFGANPNLKLRDVNYDTGFKSSGFGAFARYEDELCNQKNQAVFAMLRAYGGRTPSELGY